MKRLFRVLQVFLLPALLVSLPIFLTLGASAQITTGGQHVLFRVTLAPELGNEAAEGRLILLLSNQKDPVKVIEPEMGLHDFKVWLAASEVQRLAPGASVELDPDVLAYPEPWSHATVEDYQVMAVLDINHHYAYNHLEAGDLYSAVMPLKHFDPAGPQVIDLNLVERFHEQPVKLPASMVKLDFVSPSLSAFWGRAIHMRGIVVLPPDYSKNKFRRFPTVYWTAGFTAPFRYLQTSALGYSRGMADHLLPEMIYVLLDQECPGGTHEFADSANNGPWGNALTKELIPYLEHKYHMDSKPSGRLLTGHSSGGWAAMWLQVAYPTFFGGAWPTSPDPLDFRSFTGPNLLKDKNFYHKADGSKWMLIRSDGKDKLSLEDFSRMEYVLGEYGGQISSFEWVFSPRGPDGRPEQLFDRETGEIHPDVAQAWEKYDVAAVLKTNASRLKPLLQDKIHVTVGTADTYHLDESALLLEEDLKELGIHAHINFLPGKDHFNLYDNGLREQIAKEMEEVARPPRVKAQHGKN
jgi:S-formylglutathione hydrolase FrmB